MEIQTFSYDNRIVRNFAIASVGWGFIGMLVGLLVAFDLVFPSLNLSLPFTTYGRIRPIHTNAVIFAFVGNAIFMGVYYSLPRLCKAPMFSALLSKIHFWGWQLIIVLAAVTLALGITTSKEYAELEWPIDILIALIWVVFAINMFGTIFKRRERHMYVGIWFYIATVVTVAVLHIVNSFENPVSFLKSYSLYAGVQDALVQWWYGHNAVAFFLTTPYLGLMYYFLPESGEPAGLFVSPVDRPLLVADLPLHLGRAAPPAVHVAARLGAVARDGLLHHAHRSVLGRHDQRPADAARCVGQGA